MWTQLRRIIPPNVKRQLIALDRALDRRTLTTDAFSELLKRAGCVPGATVMVHSSMDEIGRRLPELNPMTMIQLLQRLLGPEGTLLMPTFPFAGKQLRYVEKTDRFDVKRTPSQVGLLTEVFRRLPGVQRSFHPTHSVAGWGKHASSLLDTHHLGGAFGEQSPFYRLRNHNGLVVGLGTGLRDSFTILHVPEEIHPMAKSHFFDPATRAMTIVENGTAIRYEFQALRADVQRNYDRVENCLIRDGILKYVSEGGLRCATMNANAFLARAMELVDKDRYL